MFQPALRSYNVTYRQFDSTDRIVNLKRTLVLGRTCVSSRLLTDRSGVADHGTASVLWRYKNLLKIQISQQPRVRECAVTVYPQGRLSTWTGSS